MEQMKLELQRHRIVESQFSKCMSDLQNECVEKTIKLHQTQQPRMKPAFKPGKMECSDRYEHFWVKFIK